MSWSCCSMPCRLTKDVQRRSVPCAGLLRLPPLWSPGWAAENQSSKKNSKLKIHALCLVKNEVDVLQESLISALNWCDQIYIFDNGSNDGTWELVQKLARQHMQI